MINRYQLKKKKTSICDDIDIQSLQQSVNDTRRRNELRSVGNCIYEKCLSKWRLNFLFVSFNL